MTDDSFGQACEEADEKKKAAEEKKKHSQAQKLAKIAREKTHRSDDVGDDTAGGDWQDVAPKRFISHG